MSVDNRIVNMVFNNAKFEKGVAQTNESLTELKRNLQFTGVEKGFRTLEQAANRVRFNGLTDAISDVELKFSAMSVAAIAAIQNIVNRAVDAGVKIAKSLSVDQITAGFSKYETKTQAVQTIMAATEETWEKEAKEVGFVGDQMAYVESQIEKLNWFTDETSYNLTDMTSNISKFTSSGVRLDTATTAMIGIANAAGLAGSGIQNASHAMEGFSKAIAQGKMTRLNWNWIKTARMDTKQFKRTMIEAAEEAGTLVKVSDGLWHTLEGTDENHQVSVENFETALSDNWLRTDAILKALDKYGKFTNRLYDVYKMVNNSDTESGTIDYTTTSSLLSYVDAVREGQLQTKDLEKMASAAGVSAEEMSKTLLELGDEVYKLGHRSFAASQEAKTFTEAIDSVKDAVSTGWMTTFELIFGNYLEAKKLWTDLAYELYYVFAESGNERNSLLATWKTLGGRELLLANEEATESTEENIGALWTLFYSFVDILETVKESFTDVFGEVTAEGLLDFTQKVKDFADRLTMSEETADNLKDALRGIFSILSLGKDILVAFFKPLSGLFKNGKEGVSIIVELAGSLGRLLSRVSDVVKESGTLAKISRRVSDLVSRIRSRVDPFVKSLTSAFDITRKLLNALTVKLPKKGVLESVFEVSDLSGIRKWGRVVGSVFVGVLDSIKMLFFKTNLTDKQRSALGKFIETVLDVFEEAVRRFKSIRPEIESISSLVYSFAQVLVGDKSFSDLSGGFMGFLKDVLNLFSKLFTGKEFDESRFEKIKAALDAVKDFFINFRDSMKPIVDAIAGIFQKLFNIFKGKNVLGNIALSAINILKKIFGFFGGLAKQIGPLLETGIETIGTVITSVVDALVTAFQNGGLEKVVDLFNGGVLGVIGVKFAGLFGNLKDLSGILTEPKRLLSPLTSSLKGFSDAISGLLNAFGLGNRNDDASYLNAASQFLKSFAIAVGALAISLVALSTIDYQNLMNAVGAISIVITELLGVMTAMTKLGGSPSPILKFWEKGGKSTNPVTGLIVFAGAVLILAAALKTLSTIDANNVQASLRMFSTIMAELLAIIVVANNIETNGGDALKGLIGLAVSVLILSLALKSISKIPPNALNQAFAVLLGIIGALAVVTRAVSESKGTTAVGFAMLEMAVAISIVATALKKLAGIKDVDSLASSAIALGSVLAAFAGVIYFLISFAKINPGAMIAAAGSFFIMAAALGVITAAIAALSLLDPYKLALGAMTLLAIMTVITAILGAAAYIAPPGALLAAAGALTIMSVAMLLLVPTLTALSLLDTNKLIAAVFAIGMVLVTFIAAAAILAAEPAIIISLLKLAGAMALIGVAATLLGIGLLAIEAAIAGFGAMLDVLLASIIIIIDAIPWFLASLATALNKALGSIIDILKTVITAVLTALEELVPQLSQTVITILLAVLTQIGENIGPIVEKLVDIVINIIVALGQKLPELISATAEMLKSVVDALLHTLEDLSAEDIVKAMAGLAVLAALLVEIGVVAVAGILATALLPLLGLNLSNFVKAAKPFFDTISNYDKDTFESMKFLGEAMLTLTASSVLDGLARLFGGDTYAQFGENLEKLAPHLKNFGDEMVGFKAYAAKNAASALADIAHAFEAIPKKSTLKSLIFGDNELVDFVNQFKDAAPSLKLFGDRVDGLNTEAVGTAMACVKEMALTAQELPASNGLFQFAFGEHSLADFAYQLSALAPSLKSFSNDVAGVNIDKVTGALEVTTAFITLGQELEKTGGLAQLVSGNNSLGNFGIEIENLGTSLKWFAGDVASINLHTHIDPYLARIQKFVKMATDLNAIDVSVFSNFSDSMRILANNGLSSFSDKFEERYPELLELGKAVVTKVGIGISEGGKEAQKQTLEVATLVILALTTAVNQAIRVGANVAYGFANGLRANASAATDAASDLSNSVKDTLRSEFKIKSPSKEAEEIGRFIDFGLAAGMMKYSDAITASCDVVAGTTLANLRSSLSLADSIMMSSDAMPVVTPVFDLSELTQERRSIAGLSNAIDVAALRGGTYHVQTDIADAILSLQAIQNRETIEAQMANIRGDISELTDAISHLQLVMDTGVVAGQLAPEIDIRLGQTAIYKGRRN